jgi:SAM-dependent methyltransferase
VTGTSGASRAASAAESYYDSSDADQFYFHVWGGEDIHVGIYTDAQTSIRDASRRTVEHMIERLEQLGPLTPDTRILDLGAGYGGAARCLAKRFGCPVTCLNLSETQNARNRELTAAAGLDQVQVVHGNFEALPFADASFDVAWSQDAFLHSGERQRVIEEIARVLAPGGRLVFTDPMQAPSAAAAELGPILARIDLEDLASFEFYREAAAKAGLELVAIEDRSDQLAEHYRRIRAELEARRAEIEAVASPAYVVRMLEGLSHWVRAGQAGQLAWGILAMRKPG